MSHLAISVGNSSTQLAAMVDGKPAALPQRINNSSLENLAGVLRTHADLLKKRDHAPIVIASVAPGVCEQVTSTIRSVMNGEIYYIREDIPLPLKLDVDNPETVGVDRVLCAAAAYHQLQRSCVVADFGTALTIDAVSEKGSFMGGAIMPGLHIAADALHERTAALPRVVPLVPPHDSVPLGRNTAEAIEIGLYVGYQGMLREVIERYATAMGHWPSVIATGGDAPLFAAGCPWIDRVVEELPLLGIALAYDRFAKSRRL